MEEREVTGHLPMKGTVRTQPHHFLSMLSGYCGMSNSDHQHDSHSCFSALKLAQNNRAKWPGTEAPEAFSQRNSSSLKLISQSFSPNNRTLTTADC